MATNLPYTLQDVQDRLETLINNSNDTPTSGDDEWNTRLNLIYQAIGNWEGQDILWRELWKTYTHASTVSTSTSYTIANADFKAPPAGFVRLILNGSTSYIPVASPAQYQTHGGEARVCYFTGSNKDGWTLNLGWTPVSGDGTYGATIKFDYYKMADRPSGTTDKFEMSDPNYIIYWVAAQKSLLESKNNQFSVFNTLAEDCMDRMRVANSVSAEYNDNLLEDVDNIGFSAALGD